MPPPTIATWMGDCAITFSYWRCCLGLGHERVAHLAEALDLGLHHVAGVDEGVGALADAAAGAADEDVANLDAENVGGVFDLLLGREDELRGVAVLLDRAIQRESDEQLHMIL